MRKSSGARLAAEITSTKPVSINGLLRHVTRESVVFYVEPCLLTFWSGTQLMNMIISRTDWPADAEASLDMTSLMSRAQRGEDGYMNVAGAVGLSGRRDYSTYHQYWVNGFLGRRRGR